VVLHEFSLRFEPVVEVATVVAATRHVEFLRPLRDALAVGAIDRRVAGEMGCTRIAVETGVSDSRLLGFAMAP
jgi:hypothetical protein